MADHSLAAGFRLLPTKASGLLPGHSVCNLSRGHWVIFISEYLRSSPVGISSLMLHTHPRVSPTLQNFSNGQRR